MAAPTVGAVMADILPYLGVEQSFGEDEIAGKTVVLEDMTGMTAKQAEKVLKEATLGAKMIGTGDTVTGQIPAAGEAVPGGSQVMLYMGDEPETEMVTVPDFMGMNRQQASDAAGQLGLYVLVTGNASVSHKVTAVSQSIASGSQVPRGTTIELKFLDTNAAD